MQLTNIKGKVSMAAAALLQVASHQVQAAQDWTVDAATLFYSESDQRVKVFEPALHGVANLSEDQKLELNAVFDSLTGATPNGAHATNSSQTFTSASGNKSYTAKPGETPMDNSFRDARFAGSANYTTALDRLTRVTLGASLSSENDYLSVGTNAMLAKDFNNKNTTLSVGLAFSHDTVEPTGGMPKKLTPMNFATRSNRARREGGEGAEGSGGSATKLSTDMIVGLTQVLNRKTLVQVNYSLGRSSGYLNDPSKIISVIDPNTRLPASIGYFNTAVTKNLPYLYENRPDARQRQSVYVKAVRHLTQDVINFSWRYYRDDWNIVSHTFDLKYRYQMDGAYLQPHIRLYHQTAASFKRHDLLLGRDVNAVSGAVAVQYASNDYRLADSRTVTFGLKYGEDVSENQKFSLRAEWMNQTIAEPGVVEAEKTPGLKAIILQLNYSLKW